MRVVVYIFIFFFFIALPLSGMELIPGLSQELKNRKLYAQDFKALGVEYLASLCTNVDKTKIISLSKFSLKRGKNKCELQREPQQKNLQAQINHQFQAPIYLKYINDTVGFGAFADAPIKELDSVGEYTGYLCVEQEFDQEVDSTYSIDVGSFYTDELGSQLYVDAKKSGNFMRFMNHSYEPNVHSLSVYNPVDGVWHVMMYASQYIPKDSQLLINYGSGFWESQGVEPVDLTANS